MLHLSKLNPYRYLFWFKRSWNILKAHFGALSPFWGSNFKKSLLSTPINCWKNINSKFHLSRSSSLGCPLIDEWWMNETSPPLFIYIKDKILVNENNIIEVWLNLPSSVFPHENEENGLLLVKLDKSEVEGALSLSLGSSS